MPLQITFQPMSFMKFQMFASMTHGFKEAAKQQGASAGAELDEIKRMLLETNPYFLGLTALVSVLHMVYASLCVALLAKTDRSFPRSFEMLAFKNDVSHWRQKKEMVGVSVRYVFILFCFSLHDRILIHSIRTVSPLFADQTQTKLSWMSRLSRMSSSNSSFCCTSSITTRIPVG